MFRKFYFDERLITRQTRDIHVCFERSNTSRTRDKYVWHDITITTTTNLTRNIYVWPDIFHRESDLSLSTAEV